MTRKKKPPRSQDAGSQNNPASRQPPQNLLATQSLAGHVPQHHSYGHGQQHLNNAGGFAANSAMPPWSYAPYHTSSSPLSLQSLYQALPPQPPPSQPSRSAVPPPRASRPSYQAVPPPPSLLQGSYQVSSPQMGSNPGSPDPTAQLQCFLNPAPSSPTIDHGPTSHVTIPATASPGPTTIEYTPEYMQKLRDLIHPESVLEKNGYVVRELTAEQVEGKRRCSGCLKQMSGLGKASQEEIEKALSQKKKMERLYKGQTFNEKAPSTTGENIKTGENTFRCKFHPGKVINKHWTCCTTHVTSAPCTGLPAHLPSPYARGTHYAEWEFDRTPPAAPAGAAGRAPRAAVALDCEMGRSAAGAPELVRLTLLDYFSGAALVDALVFPAVPMAHLNTRYSGVAWRDLHRARARGECLMGKREARRAVWRFVGRDTVVVGHGAGNDLGALRWVHGGGEGEGEGGIVDTFVIEARRVEEEKKKAREEAAAAAAAAAAEEGEEDDDGDDVLADEDDTAEDSLTKQHDGTTPARHPPQNQPAAAKKKPKGSGRLSLKSLAKAKLGRDIQDPTRGHDSLEDALATRDILHWMIMNDAT
ncbi:hypothetical protein BDY21DRAFT_424300 [Lineolata rhizophorae]|uniref:Exonuclease domain-containing protein n=1 Tax=Lineolata rhizophorae TaxID=578093 RepID=A0A6A6NPG4_9PEZI|nr:hypothetical protein BDY21DRAFT_424300 [Lineolata rhizophorae]